MEDKKLLKIAENCCSDMVNCERCPLDADALTADECMAKVIRLLLEIVSRQKAEIKKKDTEIAILIRKNEALKDEVSELRAEVERLKKANESFSCLGMLYSEIKSEARKEFAEWLETQITPTFSALFRISETLVDVSKSHISSDIAIDKIREELRQNDIVCSRFKYSQMLDNLLAEMEERE